MGYCMIFKIPVAEYGDQIDCNDFIRDMKHKIKL